MTDIRRWSSVHGREAGRDHDLVFLADPAGGTGGPLRYLAGGGADFSAVVQVLQVARISRLIPKMGVALTMLACSLAVYGMR